MMNEPWYSHVKRLGRTQAIGERLWLAHSASGIAFMVTATRCVIRLHGDSTTDAPDETTHTARYALYVDGERVTTAMMMTPQLELTVFAGDALRTAQVMLLKISESAMSTLGVDGVDTDGEMAPVPDRAHLVEFVGDSITCGYGVDTDGADKTFHTNNEDATKAYAWRTAEKLDVDRSLVCLSGWGVLSGWTGDPTTPSPDQLIPAVYEQVGFSYALSDGMHAQEWPWDFSVREPEVVVVNLGTNDASYTVEDADKQAQFRARYLAFLKQLRRCNPHAHLLCVLGAMGDVLYASVAQAAAEYTAQTGDADIETLRLEPIRPETEGYVADFHPTEKTHARVAEAVAERVRALLER